MDSWQVFAENLFRREDADPMYYALGRADLDTDTKLRFFVGWCTYYHPGVAADAAQYTGIRFWTALRQQYETAPRASERRHFRGRAGLAALEQWQTKYPTPEYMVMENYGNTYFEVRKNLQDVAQFGDYFYWKFADVQERVFRVPCSFDGAAPYSPSVPKLGAALIAPEQDVGAVYDLILRSVAPRLAPPWYDRPLNIQEAETICCVFHQYHGGGYQYYGHRTAKALRRLAATGPHRNKVAEALLEALTLSLPHQPKGEDE